jgi:LysR family transcriptional regulator, salicylic acid-responsive activator of bsdBCD
MDNRQLYNFLAIVEEGGISKAAEKLHIAQPYLSQQLKILEEELGVKLVERTTRRFHVTEAGKVLSYRAKQILDLSEAAVKEVKDFNEGIKGTLSIGCLTSAIETLLTKKIYEFHEEYQSVNFDIRQYGTEEILELLKRGIIEIGIIRSPFNSDIFESIELPVEPMVAVAGKDISKGFTGSHVSLEELADKPLLVNRRFENGILDLFQRKGLTPRILCKVEDTRPLLLLAQLGMGIAIVPRDWTSLVAGSDLKCLEIPELIMDTRTIVVWLKNHYMTLAAKNFLKRFY